MYNLVDWTSALLIMDKVDISSNLTPILLTASGVSFVVAMLLFVVNQKRKHTIRKIKKQNEELEKKVSDLDFALEEEKKNVESVKEYCEELKKQEEKNRKLMMTDYVTGLPNRIAFTEILNGVLRTLRKDEIVAVMYIDVNNFKEVNETLGRSYGDELLIDVADRIKQVTNEDDFFACFGGDEFFILTQNIADVGEYEEKVKKICNVFSYPFILAARELFITISIGIVFAPRDGKTTQTLLKNVDYALFQAKAGGKNNYSYYDETINKELMEQIEVQAQLRNAIESKQFLVYYQPQVDLKNNKIDSFEALLRWNYPGRGILLPDKFMHIAETTGLIVPIGKWMLEEVCLQLKKWEAEGMGKVKVTINMSGRQFKDSKLSTYVAEILEQNEVSPSQIGIEITEDIALEDLDYTIEVMEHLREIGVGCSLDRFGTAYSSVNYLKRIPVERLKIDKNFLTDISEKKEEDIIRALILLIKAIGLNVVALGVESVEQEMLLKDAGCNNVQGFLYGEPMQAELAGRLLQVIKEGGRIEDAFWF